MTQKSLVPADIYGSDPLAQIFFARLKFKPLALAAFFVFMGILYAFALPLALWKVGPAADAISILNIALTFPAAGYFYAHQPASILRLYQCTYRFLREENDEHGMPYEKLRAWHARAGWWLVGILFGGISAIFGVINAQYDFGAAWHNFNLAQLFIIQFVRFLAVSMIGLIAARHIAASIALNNLLRHARFPLTLDVDRLEIFNEVKKFSLEIVGIIAILGLYLGLEPLVIVVPMPEYAFYVTLYLLIAPVSFFLPLWQAHRRMVAIKEEMLDKMHTDFQEESEKLYDALSQSREKDLPDTYVEMTEKLSSIKNAIEIIEKSPDWPFQGTTLYRVTLTALSPFVLAIWNVVMDGFNGFLGK